MSYIDLSVAINEQMPVFPGDPQTKIAPGGILSKDGYEDHYISIGTHAGTHIDAPRHMIKNGASLDQLPLERFVGRGVLIDATQQFDLASVKKAVINEGDIVLFSTGMEKAYGTPDYLSTYPSITEEIATYLVSKKVTMVGMDMCSPDHAPFPVHKILLGNGILIIENLTNLTQLFGKEFTVYAFPLKLSLDGSPARVIAEIISA